VRRHLLVGAVVVAAVLLLLRTVSAQDVGEPATGDPAVCAPDDPREPNDSIATATALDLTVPVTAVACDGDTDVYAVEILDAGVVLVADVGFTNADGDLALEIQDSAGQVVAEADGDGDNEHLEHTMTAPGDYYVVVTAYRGSASYELDLSTRACLDDTYEPNDGVDSARSFSAGQQVSGVACPGNDDYYAVNAVAASPIVAWVSFVHQEGDIDLEVRDANDAIVAQSGGYTDLEQIEFTPSESGTYYLVVYGEGSANSYGLTAVASPPAEEGSRFAAVDPVRILDSRSGSQIGPYSSKWGPEETREVTVAGLAGVPLDAEAVALNVTVTGTSASSNLRIWPNGGSLPLGPTMNWQAGWTIAHAVTAKVGEAGAVSVYNNNGTTDVVIDVVGYYGAGLGAGFVSVEPTRVLDSRAASQVGAFSSPWGPQETREVTMVGMAGVPDDADAVILNVTATAGSSSSNLRLWPTGLPVPLVSSLNWQAGWSIANAVTVKVGEGGQVSVYNNNGTADVVIDLVGYFKTGTGASFHPIEPQRIQDSRPGAQVGSHATRWSGPETRAVPVTGIAGVPQNASSVMLNVAVSSTTASSNLRVWPSGLSLPTISSLNWQPGWSISNATTARVGNAGTVDVYNNNGFADVMIDVYGWYG
jgi:hypothetical protein